MIKLFRLTLSLFILSCGLANAGASEIPVLEIADRVIVPGPKIYLADLGTVNNISEPEKLNLMVDLGPAPYPGQVRTFSRDYLGLILKQKGFVQGLEIRMGPQVEVRVESTCVTGAQLEAAVQKALPSNDPSILKKWVELRNLPAETWLSKGEWQIKALPLGELPRVGAVLFRITLSKGSEVKNINVNGKIRAIGRVYQSVRDLNRHSLVNESDFLLVETELKDGTEILGPIPAKTRTTRIVKRGETLEAGHLQPLPLVIKDNIVNVRVKGQNILINMTGVAVKDGWLGDRITIQNPAGKKVFQGRVIGSNLVEVVF